MFLKNKNQIISFDTFHFLDERFRILDGFLLNFIYIPVQCKPSGFFLIKR